jgi:hypothetical protein
MSETWEEAIKVVAEHSGWEEPALSKYAEAFDRLVRAGKPDIRKKAVDGEIKA